MLFEAIENRAKTKDGWKLFIPVGMKNICVNFRSISHANSYISLDYEIIFFLRSFPRLTEHLRTLPLMKVRMLFGFNESFRELYA